MKIKKDSIRASHLGDTKTTDVISLTSGFGKRPGVSQLLWLSYFFETNIFYKVFYMLDF